MTESKSFGVGIFCLVILCFSSLLTFAQSEPGDLMFVGFNADGTEGFALAAMREIPGGSEYYITDNEWNGMAPGSGGQFADFTEGIVRWNTGSNIIPAGTVINFNGTHSTLNSNYGTDHGNISGEIRIDNQDEVLYLYLGNDSFSPTKFVSAITNGTFADGFGTLDNTGLNTSLNAVQIDGGNDIMIYSGPTDCNISVEECLSQISSASNWSTQDGPGSQDRDGIAPDFPKDVPSFFFGAFLPIELEAITVRNIDDREILISWSTLSETNNDYFAIERSIEGDDWITIGQLEGAGNSIERLEYNYLDKDPFVGTSYYRLKQTDFNGEYSYSDILSAKLEAPINISLFPNPTSERMTISARNLDLQTLRFFNSLGHEIILEEENSSQTKRTFITKNLVNGIYFLKAGEGKTSITTTFLKQ